MPGSGQGHREDTQIHRGLQGTRILRGGRATPTDSDYNKHLHLKLRDVHKGYEERGREKDRERDTQGSESRRDKREEDGSESEGVR